MAEEKSTSTISYQPKESQKLLLFQLPDDLRDKLVQILDDENKHRSLNEPSPDLTARFNVLKASYPKM